MFLMCCFWFPVFFLFRCARFRMTCFVKMLAGPTLYSFFAKVWFSAFFMIFVFPMNEVFHEKTKKNRFLRFVHFKSFFNIIQYEIIDFSFCSFETHRRIYTPSNEFWWFSSRNKIFMKIDPLAPPGNIPWKPLKLGNQSEMLKTRSIV